MMVKQTAEEGEGEEDEDWKEEKNKEDPLLARIGEFGPWQVSLLLVYCHTRPTLSLSPTRPEL